MDEKSFSTFHFFYMVWIKKNMVCEKNSYYWLFGVFVRFSKTVVGSPHKTVVGSPHSIEANVLYCKIEVNKLELQSCYYNNFSNWSPWERHEIPYPSSYRLNYTSTGLVWFLWLMAYQLFLGYLMPKPFS